MTNKDTRLYVYVATVVATVCVLPDAEKDRELVYSVLHRDFIQAADDYHKQFPDSLVLDTVLAVLQLSPTDSERNQMVIRIYSGAAIDTLIKQLLYRPAMVQFTRGRFLQESPNISTASKQLIRSERFQVVHNLFVDYAMQFCTSAAYAPDDSLWCHLYKGFFFFVQSHRRDIWALLQEEDTVDTAIRTDNVFNAEEIDVPKEEMLSDPDYSIREMLQDIYTFNREFFRHNFQVSNSAGISFRKTQDNDGIFIIYDIVWGFLNYNFMNKLKEIETSLPGLQFVVHDIYAIPLGISKTASAKVKDMWEFIPTLWNYCQEGILTKENMSYVRKSLATKGFTLATDNAPVWRSDPTLKKATFNLDDDGSASGVENYIKLERLIRGARAAYNWLKLLRQSNRCAVNEYSFSLFTSLGDLSPLDTYNSLKYRDTIYSIKSQALTETDVYAGVLYQYNDFLCARLGTKEDHNPRSRLRHYLASFCGLVNSPVLAKQSSKAGDPLTPEQILEDGATIKLHLSQDTSHTPLVLRNTFLQKHQSLIGNYFDEYNTNIPSKIPSIMYSNIPLFKYQLLKTKSKTFIDYEEVRAELRKSREIPKSHIEYYDSTFFDLSWLEVAQGLLIAYWFLPSIQEQPNVESFRDRKFFVAKSANIIEMIDKLYEDISFSNYRHTQSFIKKHIPKEYTKNPMALPFIFNIISAALIFYQSLFDTIDILILLKRRSPVNDPAYLKWCLLEFMTYFELGEAFNKESLLSNNMSWFLLTGYSDLDRKIKETLLEFFDYIIHSNDVLVNTCSYFFNQAETFNKDVFETSDTFNNILLQQYHNIFIQRQAISSKLFTKLLTETRVEPSNGFLIRGGDYLKLPLFDSYVLVHSTGHLIRYTHKKFKYYEADAALLDELIAGGGFV